MRVDALMSTDIATVRPETDLRVAIGQMRSHDCGFLPVVEGNGRVVGVLTDRDVALALGTDDVRPSERSVADGKTRDPHTCRVNESAHQALRWMASKIASPSSSGHSARGEKGLSLSDGWCSFVSALQSP